MVANGHFTRVDIIELKDLIYRKIGYQRAEKYFDHLKRFFWLKLNKVDFDKCCINTIGRENIPLHNLLIRSIARNACHAKVPPQKTRKFSGVGLKAANGYQTNSLQSLYRDALPQSPRKCRSSINRDRKIRDRPVTPRSLGKSPNFVCEETITRIQEHEAKELHSVYSRPPAVEDGEEVEQCTGSPDVGRWSLVTAPLGVSVKMDGVRKALHCGLGHYSFGETCQNKGELPDTVSLRGRLEKKLALDGVGISMDCANLVNNSLDVFLKRLIEPCIGIAGSRYRDNPCSQVMSRLNGGLGQVTRGQRYASPLDFRVSMESNPCLLGEDWPMQLEKVCHYALQE